MNGKEWKKKTSTDYKSVDHTWAAKARKFQKSLQYNSNPKATIIHHLRDTEEQRKYNDEHYELWGFNEDGTFEYGKYVIFVTKEEHAEIHSQSDETRRKISESIRAIDSEERRKRISEATKAAMTEEAKRKCSESHKGIKHSIETRKKMSESAKNRVNDDFRNKMRKLQSDKMSFDYKQHLGNKMKKIMAEKKVLYKEYKESGGTMMWNDFQKYIKENDLLSFNK